MFEWVLNTLLRGILEIICQGKTSKVSNENNHDGVIFGKSERPMHITLLKRDFFSGFLVVFKTF